MPMPRTLHKIAQSKNNVIYQTNTFNDGLHLLAQRRYKNKKKLALFDLDNTILSYRHTLGTDQWFDFDFNQFIQQGLQPHEAKQRTLGTALNVIGKIHDEDIYVVEENTPAAIRKLQDNGIATLVLTSRGKYLREQTVAQLARFELDFNRGVFKDQQFDLPQTNQSECYHGLILTDGQNKGDALIFCLEKMPEPPEVIMMWDDKQSNLDKVSDAIKRYNEKNRLLNKQFVPIEFIGIRYSRLDDVIKHVKPEVVALQKKYFNRILSNDDALAIARAERKKTISHCVDIDYPDQGKEVIISIRKAEHYRLLLDLVPGIMQHCKQGVHAKIINGKEKLVYQFQYKKSEFKPLFQKLSQHGLIEPAQFDRLNSIFNPPEPPPITHLYNLRPRDRLPQYHVDKQPKRLGIM